MKIPFEKDKAHMEVLKVFRLMIRDEYRDGGWLPSAREMSKRLNVSTGTYVKATKRLVSESIAENYPRKGIYIIPEKYRVEKIGVVIANGEDSPFLEDASVLSAVLSEIDKGGFNLHLIQGSPVSNVARNALSHYVSGLVWISPTTSACKVIGEIRANNLFPIIVGTSVQPTENDIPPEDVPFIQEDYQAMAREISTTFIVRGHKRVLYLGDKWFADYNGLEARFRKAGVAFSVEEKANSSFHENGWLLKVMKKKKPTGVIVEGTNRSVETVFQELSALPTAKQPDLLVRKFPRLPKLIEQFLKAKVIGVADVESEKIGEAAAKHLLEHLKDGAPLKSAEIATYSIKAT